MTKIRYILNKTKYLENFRSRNPDNVMRIEDIETAIINKDRAAMVSAKINFKKFHYFYNNLLMRSENYIQHFSQKP